MAPQATDKPGRGGVGSAPTRSSDRRKHEDGGHQARKQEAHVASEKDRGHRDSHRRGRSQQHHGQAVVHGGTANREHHSPHKDDSGALGVPMIEGVEPYRGISTTEVHYPSPEAAQRAFAYQRALDPRPALRRVPTPYARRRSDSPSPNSPDARRSMHRASNASLASKVSFGSHVHTIDGERDADCAPPATHGAQDIAGDTRWPAFGSSRGIGHPSQAIEYIGLGRKEPRHRVFQADMLRPALRSSRSGVRDKPLPRDPQRYPQREHRTIRGGNYISDAPVYPVHRSHASLGPGMWSAQLERPVPSRSHSRASAAGSLGALFRSLSMKDRAPPEPIEPARDLFNYIRTAEMQPWLEWPLSRTERQKSWWERNLSGYGGGVRGMDEMSVEWFRRLQEAEQGRVVGRNLKVWEAAGERWLMGICQFQENNFPAYPIHAEARWGSQPIRPSVIFALPANGFDTVDYHDDEAHRDPDFGLLSWLCGAVLQTAISALDMIRQSENVFHFQLIPAPRPPTADSHAKWALWDGFGTFVLVNKADDMDRAMLLAIRPPSVTTSRAMREFARSSRGESWWHVPAESCTGDAGQANLLQAQIYDDAVLNRVYYFVVTNTTEWVFGSFNSNYTKATVSPVIDVRQRDPNVLQCLTAWVVRSLDEVRYWPDQALRLASHRLADFQRERMLEPSSPSRPLMPPPPPAPQQQPYDFYPSPPMTPSPFSPVSPMSPVTQQQPMYYDPPSPYAQLPAYSPFGTAGAAGGYAQAPHHGHHGHHGFGSLGSMRYGGVGWYGPNHAGSVASLPGGLGGMWGGMRM